MRSDLLSLMVCPYCGGSLEAGPGRIPSGQPIEYGILSCGCSEFPVVGGIPIFKASGRVDLMHQTTASVMRAGPRGRDLIKDIKAGRNERALLSLLTIPGRLTAGLLAITEATPSGMRGGAGKLADRLWSWEKRRAKAVVIDAVAGMSALDLLSFFYRRSMTSELYNHFTYHFGQPRQLAGLSLATLMPGSGEPVLDLACGFGHFMHYWAAGRRGQRVIGIDRNFFQLYVAKNRIAPDGDYICSEADVRLPLRSRSLGGIFCSDAFHCFLGRWQSAEEMKRLVKPGGIIVLSRFGNRRVEPREGYELSPEGYIRLFDDRPVRLISEREVLGSYLEKKGPPLGRPPDREHLAGQKWLSLVASDDPGLFRDHPEFGTWPHAAGRLALNPLYHEIARSPDGEVTVEFRFPSKWYEFENAGCREYMPATATLRPDALAILASGSGEWNAEVEALVRQCVVVGMPDRYR